MTLFSHKWQWIWHQWGVRVCNDSIKDGTFSVSRHVKYGWWYGLFVIGHGLSRSGEGGWVLGYLHGLFPALMEETTFRPLPNSLLFSALWLYLLLESFFPSDSHLMRLEMILTVSQPHQFIFPYKYFQFSVKEHTLRCGLNLIYSPKGHAFFLYSSAGRVVLGGGALERQALHWGILG